MVLKVAGSKKKFAGRGRGQVMFNRGLEMFQKMGYEKRGVEKKLTGGVGGLQRSKKLFPLKTI